MGVYQRDITMTRIMNGTLGGVSLALILFRGLVAVVLSIVVELVAQGRHATGVCVWIHVRPLPAHLESTIPSSRTPQESFTCRP